MSFAATSTSAACGRRALLLSAAAVIAGAAALFGGAGGASATSLVRIGTTTLISVSPASADSSQTVTFSATVAAASGSAPTGSVEFDAHFTAVGGTTGRDIVVGTQTLTSGSGSQSTATLTVTGLQAGTYSVTGSYNPPAGSLSWSGSTSVATPLSIGVAPLNSVSMTFSLSSQTINAGENVTFSTKVTGQPGLPAPTGVVVFSAGPDVNNQDILKTATLASDGTASATIGGWSGGTYLVAASYQGDPVYLSTSQDLSLAVNAVSEAVQTTTTVALQPSTIAAGSMVTIHIHVQQQGNPLAPPAGDLVNLSVGQWGGNPTAAIPVAGEQGIALDAEGDATVTLGGWTAGDFAVYAGFVGDVFDATSTGVGHLTVTSPTNGSSISYSGATQASYGGQATLAGHLVDGTGAPLPGEQLILSIDGPGGTSCFATTDPNGDAFCTVNVQAQPGPGAVTVAFFGDATYQAASADAQFTVLAVPTATSYTGDTTGGTGAQATLSAHLQRVEDATPIAGELVTLLMGAETCTATTNAGGDASCRVTLTEGTGSYAVTATFAGDGGYLTSSGSGTFHVTTQATTTATGNRTANAGAATSFSATLTSGTTPVAGKTITIAAGAQSCSGVTDATGTASCSITLNQAVGTYTITATFAASGGYLGSSGTGTLTIQKVPTTTTYTGATKSLEGAPATLSAYLTGAPDGAAVSFTVGTESCTGTVAGGNASCQVTIADAPGGNYKVTATYAGDATHTSSSDFTSFTVISPVTMTHVAGVGPVLAGSSVTLSATVTPSSAPGIVTFSSGNTTLCAPTLSFGAASCSATFAQSGTYTVTARYGGNGLYLASSDSTSVLVYALAPGGGSFVVGDKRASSAVTFWGARWSKLNTLSAGAAPNAFKGFALNPSAAKCGVPWSTDPGNSSPPPAGPLPAYMAVIVTSKATQAGSQISGNIVAIVIVKTNAGYSSDPGHAGTGTVVATVCGG